MDVTKHSAVALSAEMAAGRLSATELMAATLERIAATNETVNAIVSLRDGDALMAEAQAADSAERDGWLHGIPIAIKDLANAQGLPTSMGSPLFAGTPAASDDLMVARLRAAGAILIGKTNTPEFGLGSHTFNPVFGATCNPYGPSRSAGGSSGGAAASLAAGMLSVADGSDMMGSLRNPAGWNNVYGMRPTWGAVPGEPLGDLYLHQLATSGPMARCPADLAALLDTMTGADPRQPLSFDLAPTAPELERGGGAWRMAWLGDWGGALAFEAGLIDLSETALSEFETLGAIVEPLSGPHSLPAIWDSWTTLRSFAVAAGLGALYADADKRRHLKGTALWEIERGLALTGAQIQAASLARADWYRAACGLFDRFDVLVLPTAQVWPFDVIQEHPTEIAGQSMDTYHRWMEVVVPASLLGLPVVNVPIGFGQAGLPAGLQLIGPRGSDARLLQIAQAWHSATDWPGRRPPPL